MYPEEKRLVAHIDSALKKRVLDPKEREHLSEEEEKGVSTPGR